MLSRTSVLVVCLLLRFEVALSGAYFQARSCVLAESRLDSKCKDLVVSPACVNVTNQVQLVVTPSENTTKPILLGLLIYEGSLAARDQCTQQDLKPSSKGSCTESTEAGGIIAGVAVSVFVVGCIAGILGTVGFIRYISPRLCNTRSNQEKTSKKLRKATSSTDTLKCCDIIEVSATLESSPSFSTNVAYGEISKT